MNVNVDRLAAATAGLSGADLKALCQQAAVHALMRAREKADPAASDPAPAVLAEDFERALASRR